MRNIILFIGLVMGSLSLNSQSTERFIRIIGNAEHTFEATQTRTYFSISEVAPNEYKKISYKSIETTYSEFLEQAGKLGIKKLT